MIPEVVRDASGSSFFCRGTNSRFLRKAFCVSFRPKGFLQPASEAADEITESDVGKPVMLDRDFTLMGPDHFIWVQSRGEHTKIDIGKHHTQRDQNICIFDGLAYRLSPTFP